GVDLHRDAAQRGAHVLADERAAAAQRLHRALDVHRVVRQLPLTPTGVAEQHPDAAVDVELRVAAGGPGAVGQRVQLVAVLAQRGGQRLQQRGPLVERQLAQRRPADPAAVVQRAGQVQAGRGDPGHLIPGDRVVQRHALVRGRTPTAGQVTAQDRHPGRLLGITYHSFSILAAPDRRPNARCDTRPVTTTARPARRGRPGDDRESLLRGAIAVFNERGYDGTSMDDLARRLGITKAAIYHHVAGKQELLRLAVDHALDGLFALAAEVQAADGRAIDRLERLVRGSVEVLAARLPYVTLLLRVRGNTPVEQAALARRREFDRLVTKLVEQAQADGDRRAVAAPDAPPPGATPGPGPEATPGATAGAGPPTAPAATRASMPGAGPRTIPGAGTPAAPDARRPGATPGAGPEATLGAAAGAGPPTAPAATRASMPGAGPRTTTGAGPAVTARLLFGMVNSLVEWYAPDGPLDPAALPPATSALAFDGLRRPPG